MTELGIWDTVQSMSKFVDDTMGEGAPYYFVAIWLGSVLLAVAIYLLSRRKGGAHGGEKQTPRGAQSKKFLMARYIPKGVNDDLYFSAISASQENTNEMTVLNPFRAPDDPKAKLSAHHILERKVAISIGADHSEAPYASEDAERMQTLFEKMGYKTSLFSSKSTTPSSTAFARILKQIKFSRRSFDSAAVFIAGRCRVVELDRDLLGAALSGVSKPKSAGDDAAEEEEERPFCFLELLTDERSAEDPQAWVDIHMVIQRLVEAIGTENDMSVILDLSLDVAGGQYLPGSLSPGGPSSASILAATSLKDLLWSAPTRRHLNITTVGCARHVVPATTAGKRPKHQGSFFVRRLTESFNGVASLQESAPDADPDVSADPDVEEPPVTFAIAHGNTKTGVFHCGIANAETIVSHLVANWSETVGNSNPTVSAEKPFWHCPLGLPPPIAQQEALMPKLASSMPIESWTCGGCRTSSTAELRKLAMEQARRGRNGERTSFVIGVSGNGSFRETASGGSEWQHQSGQGLTSFLRRFCWTSNMIRREILYIDLESYSPRAFDASGPVVPPRPFPFTRFVSDIGRLLCNLENILTSDEDALRFAIRTISGLKPIVVLDHFRLSGAAEHPCMKRWCDFLSCDDPTSVEELATGLDEPLLRRLGFVLSGVESRGCNAKMTLPPNDAFDPVAFCEYAQGGSLSPEVKEAVLKLDGNADAKMDMWLWCLARGHLSSVTSISTPVDLLTTVCKSLSKREHTLVMHVVAANLFRKELQFDHLSVAAVALQCGYDSPWEVADMFKSLVKRGVLFYQHSFEVGSKKEAKLLSVRVNPALQHVLTSAMKPPTLKSFAKDLMSTYVLRAKGTRGQLRSIHDGFFYPRFVCTLRCLPLSEVTNAFAGVTTEISSSKGAPASPSPVLRLLIECIRHRGVSATLDAYRSTTPDGYAAAPLVELPGHVSNRLDRHRTALMAQPNEVIQLIYDTLRRQDESLLHRHIPEQVDGLPLVPITFYRSLVSSDRSAPHYAPPAIPVVVHSLNIVATDEEKKGEKVYATIMHVEHATGNVIVGLSNGAIGLAELPVLGGDGAFAAIAETKLELNIASAGRHTTAPDTILAHGDDHWVTANRAHHEIYVWKRDFSSFEQVQQLTRPPSTKKNAAGVDSDEESDEDEDYALGPNAVSMVKRTCFTHLCSRTISDIQLGTYLRSSSDDATRRELPKPATATQAPPQNENHVVVISVGFAEPAGSRQRPHETGAPEHERFNCVFTHGIDPVKGVATISTPDNSTIMTAACVGTHPKDRILRILTADSTGKMQVHVLRTFPPVGYS